MSRTWKRSLAIGAGAKQQTTASAALSGSLRLPVVGLLLRRTCPGHSTGQHVSLLGSLPGVASLTRKQQKCQLLTGSPDVPRPDMVAVPETKEEVTQYQNKGNSLKVNADVWPRGRSMNQLVRVSKSVTARPAARTMRKGPAAIKSVASDSAAGTSLKLRCAFSLLIEGAMRLLDHARSRRLVVWKAHKVMLILRRQVSLFYALPQQIGKLLRLSSRVWNENEHKHRKLVGRNPDISRARAELLRSDSTNQRPCHQRVNRFCQQGAVGERVKFISRTYNSSAEAVHSHVPFHFYM